jgi:hypothetical protein
VAWRAEMRIFDLALAGVLATTAPMAAHANGPGSNLRATNAGPASNLVLVWDGGGSGGRSGAIGGRPTADRAQQWNRGPGFAHWGPSRQYGGWGPYGGSPVPTYWVWVPGSAVFDYPFADWRGPTGGWGNP